MESKLGFIVWLERMRDYWFPTQAQIEAARLAKEVAAARKEKSESNQHGISGFGKTQDEIDANLERLDEGLEKITWDTDRLLAPQYVCTALVSVLQIAFSFIFRHLYLVSNFAHHFN